jgi:tetratricopeptide (TPR) repeat protein
MRLPNHRLPTLLVAISALIFPVVLFAQQVIHVDAGRMSAHLSPEWPGIQKHLPNPDTASPQDLEMQGDILRARRFPEDALDFYGYALRRGADTETIYKKIGVTHLELRNIVLAQLYFQKAVKMNRKDAEAWNNLGAVEYLNRQYNSAIGDYKKSVKLDKKSAVYHSNLGMVYFDQHDYKKARIEISTALKMDPAIFTRGSSSGISAHVLSPEDRARFCLEMAKTYAQEGNEAEMLHSLSMASESGMNVQVEMVKDKTLAGFREDPRVLVIVQNAKALRAGKNGQAGLAQVGAEGRIKPLAPSVE